MLKKFFTFLALPLLLVSAPVWVQAAPICLLEKFSNAPSGDYVVTVQDGHYSVLFIRYSSHAIFLLEEISVPVKQVELKKMNWKQWVMQKAPGHTSWTLYEIDKHSGKLIECFSYSKNGWLYLDHSEQFLTRLLTLPLSPVAENDRKKIGPEPMMGEHDRRSLWNPPLVVEGKKIVRPTFDVAKTHWPNDNSRLSSSAIELYLAKEPSTFAFPFWLEVQSPHYTFKMRTVDSGHDLISPMQGLMPHRSPEFIGTTKKGRDNWKIFIQTPIYFQTLHLFVNDLTDDRKISIPVPFTAKNCPGTEEMILEMTIADLRKILIDDHRYQWLLIPEGSSDIYVESEESFSWSG